MEVAYRNLRRDTDTHDPRLMARRKKTKHNDRARCDECPALHYQEHSALVIELSLSAQRSSSTLRLPETVCDAKVCC